MYTKALDTYTKALDRTFPAGKIIFVGCRGNFSRPERKQSNGDE